MKLKDMAITIIASLSTISILASCGQNDQSSPTKPSTSNDSTTTTTTTNQTAQTNLSTDSHSGAHETTITGVVSDSMCGSDHSKMGAMGKDAVSCTQKCVESGSKYVLVDDKGDIYNVSDHKRLQIFAGKQVEISGHIDRSTKAIHLHSIAIR